MTKRTATERLTRRVPIFAPLLVLALTIVVAACGSGDDDGGSACPPDQSLLADGTCGYSDMCATFQCGTNEVCVQLGPGAGCECDTGFVRDAMGICAPEGQGGGGGTGGAGGQGGFASGGAGGN